jgi:hypothetical protein
LPERIGIETFVREPFVSEAAHTEIRGIKAQNNRAQLICKDTKVGFSAEARGEGCADIDMDEGGVGVEVGETFMERVVSKPKVGPEKP